jgi:hypothetical protein
MRISAWDHDVGEWIALWEIRDGSGMHLFAGCSEPEDQSGAVVEFSQSVSRQSSIGKENTPLL